MVKKITLFVFGLDHAGKSTIIEYLREKRFIPQTSTLGVSITEIIFKNLQLEFHDVGGQEQVRKQWGLYLQKPHVLVFVIDATDRDLNRIQAARAELDRIMQNPKVTGVPLLVLVNKIDEPTSMSKQTVKEKYNLDFAGELDPDTAVYEVSARYGTNLDAVLNAMTSMVLKDEAIEYFVSGEIKVQSKHMLSSYRDLIKKGSRFFKEGKFYESLAHLNLARDLYDNLFQLGVLPSGKEYKVLSTEIAKVEAAVDEQEKAKESRPVKSYLAALREEAPVDEKKDAIKTVSVFLFGLDRAGKTTFVEYLKNELYKEQTPTLGVNISHLVLGNIRFSFNDLGGQVALRPTWMQHWAGQDILIFMVDSTDSNRYQEAKDAMNTVLARPETRGKPLLILASKVDLPEAKPRVIVETALKLHELDRSRNDWAIYEISTKSNYNIDKALNFIVSIIIQDETVEKFISKELKRLIKNYKEMYKAYLSEVKHLEGKHDIISALDRMYKARAIQEELFKHGIAKARKEIRNCNERIHKLETRL